MRAGYVKIPGVLDKVRCSGVWISLTEMVQRQEGKKHMEDSDRHSLTGFAVKGTEK